LKISSSFIKENISKTITTVVIAAVVIVYYNFNPSHYHFFPSCAFKQITGLQCPGCGGQRAIYSLLHFQFQEAFQYNSLLVCSLPYLSIWILFENTILKKRYHYIHKIVFGNIAKIIFLMIIIGFWIGRNI